MASATWKLLAIRVRRLLVILKDNLFTITCKQQDHLNVLIRSLTKSTGMHGGVSLPTIKVCRLIARNGMKDNHGWVIGQPGQVVKLFYLIMQSCMPNGSMILNNHKPQQEL